MPAYSVSGNDAAAATETIITIEGGTNVRPHVYDIVVGCIADGAVGIHYAVKRQTAAGTGGTTPTPIPLDEDSQAAVSTAREGPTAEPTYDTENLIEWGMNQRATFRWVATPGRELIAGAAAAHGFGIQCVAIESGTPTLAATMHFFE